MTAGGKNIRGMHTIFPSCFRRAAMVMSWCFHGNNLQTTMKVNQPYTK